MQPSGFPDPDLRLPNLQLQEGDGEGSDQHLYRLGLLLTGSLYCNTPGRHTGEESSLIHPGNGRVGGGPGHFPPPQLSALPVLENTVEMDLFSLQEGGRRGRDVEGGHGSRIHLEIQRSLLPLAPGRHCHPPWRQPLEGAVRIHRGPLR